VRSASVYSDPILAHISTVIAQTNPAPHSFRQIAPSALPGRFGFE